MHDLKKPKRSFRRPAENIPGPDYITRMERLGPRENESKLAFIMRMAAMRAGREAILASAQRHYGNITDVCRELRVSRHNIPAHLRNMGLTTRDLLSFRPEYR